METLEGRRQVHIYRGSASYFLGVIGTFSRLSKTLIPQPQLLQKQVRHSCRELTPIPHKSVVPIRVYNYNILIVTEMAYSDIIRYVGWCTPPIDRHVSSS